MPNSEKQKPTPRLLFIDDERDHRSSFTSVKYRESLGLRYFTEAELAILSERPQVDVARNYNEAIALLQANKYDMICFDHDLGENQPTGMDIAKWIVSNLDYKFEFYVHSANPIGRTNIDSLLRQWINQL